MLAILLLCIFLINPPKIIGITPTPPVDNNTPLLEETPAQGSNLDEIKKIREAVQQKVQEKLKEISSPEANKKKGIVGKITKINGLDIVLEDSSLTNRNLTTTVDTIVIDKNRNKSKLENLKPGDNILAMGYTTETDTLDTKRIVIIDTETIVDPLRVTTGKIVDISRTSPVFVLIPSSDKDTQYQINTNSKTEITSPQKIKIPFSDLKNGQRVIVVFKPEDKTNKSFYATKILNLDHETETTPTP